MVGFAPNWKNFRQKIVNLVHGCFSSFIGQNIFDILSQITLPDER